MDQAAQALLEALPSPDEVLLLNIVDGFRGGEGAERFTALMDRLADQIGARIRNPDLPASIGRSRWADVWSRIRSLPGEVEGLNLDRVDAFWSVLAELRAAARLSPLPQTHLSD